jgi:hypothetical protein
MALLLKRNQLLTKEELKIEKVDLGKDEFVYVRQMTGRERDRFEQSLMKEVKQADGEVNYERSLEDFRAKLAVNTICDEKGNNLLEPDDYPTLSKHMSAARLELIVNKSQDLNRISQKDKENLVKNSDGAPSAASTSNSVKS